MAIKVTESDVSVLPEYGRVPITFRVDCIFRVEPIDGGLGGLSLREEPVAEPYDKDYDEGDTATRFQRWRRWDLSNWRVLMAYDKERLVGGAVLAFDTEGVNMLEGREDLCMLWDLRVHPDRRREGIGTALFRRAVEVARAAAPRGSRSTRRT